MGDDHTMCACRAIALFLDYVGMLVHKLMWRNNHTVAVIPLAGRCLALPRLIIRFYNALRSVSLSTARAVCL